MASKKAAHKTSVGDGPDPIAHLLYLLLFLQFEFVFDTSKLSAIQDLPEMQVYLYAVNS